MMIRVIIFVYINPSNCDPFCERKRAMFVNIFKLTRAWIYIKEIIQIIEIHAVRLVTN
jgi:hypothetical protein